jgi:hypothetical protein
MDSHDLAKAKDIEYAKLKEAFKIDTEYKPGMAFDYEE